MQKKKKLVSGRIAAFILAIVMLCGTLPLSTAAAESNGGLRSGNNTVREDVSAANMQGAGAPQLKATAITEHTVAFDPEDGITQYPDFKKRQVPSGQLIIDVPEDPVREGYKFMGWAHGLDEDEKPLLWDFAVDKVEHNITLWAAWEEAYTVAYDPDDGIATYPNFYKTQVLKNGDGLITDIPADPTREGYKFMGWAYAEDGDEKPLLWDFAVHKVDEGNITLWAAWEAAYTVAYDPNDGIATYPDFYKTQVLKSGDGLITDIPADPVREGYKFMGWAYAEDGDEKPLLWDFAVHKVDEGNITLWAAWEAAYTVAYDPNDGIATYPDFYKTEVLKSGDGLITDIPADPVREGYKFMGWAYAEDGDEKPLLWDFAADKVEHNITLWAAWEEICTVTYNRNDGSTLNQEYYKTTALKNNLIEDVPENPVRDGYQFLGWYSEINSDTDSPVFWDFATRKVEQNIVLWAAWEEKAEEHQHYAYIIGYPDQTVRPNRNISREEVSTILLRILSQKELKASWKSENSFPDVAQTKWSNNAISTLENLGVVIGYPDGNFRPGRNITRAEFATIIVRWAGLEGQVASGSHFKDVNPENWAANYINLASENNYVYGYADNSFRPNAFITRAEAIAMVNRMLGRRVNAKEDLLPEIQQSEYKDVNSKDWYYLDVMEAVYSHFCVPGPVVDGLQYEKWTRLSGTPNWRILSQINVNLDDLIYPVE